MAGSTLVPEVSAGSSAPARRSGRRRLLPEQWPLMFMFTGFPLWWVLGASNMIWPLFALPMAGRLFLRRGQIRAPPRGFGLWLLFILWVGVSAVSLQQSFPFAFIWRASNYFSVTVFFLYVYNLTPQELPTERIIGWLSNLWLITVAGGWLGVLDPNGSFTTPIQAIAPHKLASNPFFLELAHPSFAQVQSFLGFPVGRPAAPYDFTNTWGSVYALLLPFFFLSWLQSPVRSRRTKAYVILAASLVPVFVSLNRGLWLSLFVALLYGATRPGNVGRLARRSIAALLVLGVLLVALTPIGSLVSARASGDSSTAGRTFLYEQTIAATARSPVIGYGAPRPYVGPRIIPDLGTQGHLWLVMYSQGFVGLLLFLWFIGRMIWNTRQGTVVTFWCHVVLIMACIQFVVYDMVPVPLHIIFIAAALGARERLGSDAPASEPASSLAELSAADGAVAGP